MSKAAQAYTDDGLAAEYWEYQKAIGRVGGELNRWKFIDHVSDTDVVLDFGCGGGYLLEGLPGHVKLGVEPNPKARAEAERRGIHVYSRATEVESSSVDVAISHHALEHVLSPFDELQALEQVLRPGGLLVVAVPATDWRVKSERYPSVGDLNHEFYTWTPQLFFNLLTEVGFQPRTVELLTHAWHPRISPRLTRLPRRLYEFHAWSLAVVLHRRDVYAVASKRRA